MRTIAVEEHFSTEHYQQTLARATGGGSSLPPHMAEILKRQLDVGEGRLAGMDEAGIDMQVLSLSALGLDDLDRETAMPLARDCNDVLAETIATHPTRFSGLAHLALHEPEGAAEELERCVGKLGLKGAMVSGTSGGRFLDDAGFEPLLAVAERLSVPIYLHPAPPPRPVYDAYFGGLPEGVGNMLSMAGWGWHAEAGLHSLRMVVAGVFDRHPDLQIIIGHMGEGLPLFLARADEKLGPVTRALRRRVSDYFHTNFYLTTSGYFTVQPLISTAMIMGTDRLLFAVDYPYSPNSAGRGLLEMAPLAPPDLEKITHKNAERLLGL